MPTSATLTTAPYTDWQHADDTWLKLSGFTPDGTRWSRRWRKEDETVVPAAPVDANIQYALPGNLCAEIDEDGADRATAGFQPAFNIAPPQL